MRPAGGQSDSSGAMNPVGGAPDNAADMNAPHIRAGYDPPTTCTPLITIGSRECGFPSQTAAVSCGVYPTNQASLLPSVVPVLPAAGRPKLPSDPLAVPSEMTCVSIDVSVRAISGASTCRPGSALLSTVLSL